ncbi:phospholipase A2-like [Lytechinus variegatus]|uniref:phospholipase A2-like n=1 Tax=Lytechinus variegatus TaxID=7654 RepID=UPI001BB0EC2F|nr:phospholipase A2-like [Lytechinus variegatus]
MKVSIELLVIFISFASAGPPVSRIKEESVFNFGYMSSCATNSYSNRYNGYGCYCGFGGYGTPVDSLDTCCQVHDNCYGDLEEEKGGPCSKDVNIYREGYTYSCHAPWSWWYTADELSIVCDASANNACQQALCECDKTASLCFAANEFQYKYKDYDKEANCKA